MILQGRYFGLQDSPVLLKIIKINDFAIFHVMPLFYVRLFNYTITVFLQYLYQSHYFFVISHVLFVISHVLFCYQSRTFCYARNVDIYVLTKYY